MPTILIVEQNLILSELIELVLKGRFEVNTFFCHDVVSAVELLNKKPIDLVISEFNLPGQKADYLYNFIKENKKNIPFLLSSTEGIEGNPSFASFFDDHHLNSFIEQPFDQEKLFVLVEKIITEISNKEAVLKEFIRIPIEELIKRKNKSFSLYLRINRFKYVRLNNPNEEVKESSLKEKLIKGVKFLYMQKEDGKKYFEQLFTIVLSEIETKENNLCLQIQSSEQMKEFILNFGVSPLVVDLVDKTTNSIMKDIKENQKVFNILNKAMSVNNYPGQLTILINYLSLAMAQRLGLFTPQIYNKLILGNIISNISLLEHPQLVAIWDQSSEEFKSLSEKEKYLIKSHPLESFKVYEKTGIIDPDIEKIILQHHELPNGAGFPRGLADKQIAPLAVIHVISHRLAVEILKNNEVEFNKAKASEIVLNLETEYSTGAFKKPLDALKEIFRS